MSKDIIKNELDFSKINNEQTGFEEVYSETFKTPFLKILQDLSPEVKQDSAERIEGAKTGQFCNSITKKLYSELNVVVLKIVHNLLVWKPNRGGFVGAYSKVEEDGIVHKKDGLKKFDIEGNEIMDTINFFCLNIDDPTDLFILSLSVSQLKYARNWATNIQMLKANGKPCGVSFAGVWNIKTMIERNDKGSWYTIGNTPSFQRTITSQEYQDVIQPALALFKKAQVDYSNLGTEEKEETVEY